MFCLGGRKLPSKDCSHPSHYFTPAGDPIQVGSLLLLKTQNGRCASRSSATGTVRPVRSVRC